ncbi:chitobiase/beta-hexosaminidase C-terminal domain-containing protein [Priestia megaterium]|uniref:chitobiase/beta-hexosaminidase C-terminal domain-containing protein n=1 Tax=Priestia megaterium TaxID=1404 RepID=UPI00159C3478|nr:chitobiase/beta-hexosaminidase C-terminal domain-containing protein [Priestia megaterium]
MAYKIQINSSLKKNLPSLDIGEFGLCTDTGELFIGSDSGNIQIANKNEIGFLSNLTTTDKENLVNAINEIETKLINNNGANSLDELSDVDISTSSPKNGDVLKYEAGIWKPATNLSVSTLSSPYVIELNRWNIKNDGTSSETTTQGINDAIIWAKSQGVNHVILPSGFYKLKLKPWVWQGAASLSFTCINMVNDIHFEMADGCILELEGNGSPGYSIFQVKDVKNVKISGGKIIGDRKTHYYEIGLKFVRGGINPDGSLNDNPNFIRSEIMDRFKHPGLLNNFRLWKIDGIDVSKGYSFYQYRDTISSNTLVGFRNNGQFAPSAPTGRGWILQPNIEANNKMIFTIDITNNPLTDNQIAAITAKVDNERYTHEWGQGIEIAGSNHVEIKNIEICDCTGDAISTGWLKYRTNSTDYTQNEMGHHIWIHDCDIHHCRRQGITLASANDVCVYNNKIHHIGKADDNVTSDFRNGIPPMFAIDIESMVGESNIPYKQPYYNKDGLELNFRLYIFNNHIHDNERGHFVNADGNYVTVENNIFEGWNVGGVSSYPTNMYIKYLNNTFINTEFIVSGDNYVNGLVGQQSNLRLMDVRGSVIQDVRLNNGIFYGNANYGYFGTPTVDVSTSSFIINNHGMGNTAKICFEQWVGKVPSSISVDKIYYVVNRTTNSFQVSETEDGPPVTFYDSGEWGFNVSRFNYGRCYINNVVIERDWNIGGTTPGFAVTAAGSIIQNVTVKNHSVSINGNGSNIYVGRPLTVDGLTIIDGSANIKDCNVLNSQFIRNRNKSISPDLKFGDSAFPETKVNIKNSLFRNTDATLINSTVDNCSFFNVKLSKTDNNTQTILNHCYLENSIVDGYWLELKKGYLITRCTLLNTTMTVNKNPGTTLLLENIDITNSTADLNAPRVTVNPNGGIYNTDKTVTLLANEDAIIYYTLDGTLPTTSSIQYSTPLKLSNPTTLKVIAVDAAGNQSKVKSVQFNIDKTPPTNVTNLTATPFNDKVDLSWIASASNDVLNYEIYNGDTLIRSINSTTYTVTGLLAASQYSFTVKTVDKAGNKSSGISITVTTSQDTTPPEEISNLLASSITSDSIGLTWTRSLSSDVASYEIYQDSVLLNGNVTTTNYSITGLKANIQYKLTVKSKDINGNVSDGINVTVKTSAISANYVTNGLILYKDNPSNNLIIENPDSYFMANNTFTISFTAKVPKFGDLISRYELGGSQNKILLERNGNNAFGFSIWGNTANATVTSPQYADESLYYHIAVIRTDTALLMYINNVKVSEAGIANNVYTKPSSLPLIIGDKAVPVLFKNVAYYNRILTPEELALNFNALK